MDLFAVLGPEDLVARLYMKNAFRLLSVHDYDYSFIGFTSLGKIFLNKCLPFGCSISCSIFEKCSTFVEWLHRQEAKSINVVHFLDNFLVAG